MSFFDELGDNLSQTMNHLISEEGQEPEDDQIVNTLDAEDLKAKEASEKMIDEWLNEYAPEDNSIDTSEILQDDEIEDRVQVMTDKVAQDESEPMDDNVDLELLKSLNEDQNSKKENRIRTSVSSRMKVSTFHENDETIVTKGTMINGSISTDGSLDIMGTVNGDVTCIGKLSVTGKVNGNLSAADVFVNTERLEGNITSEGNIKVGLGTVVIGNITATSGVIAGAVKGEIDINGPVVIDSTSIIKGNINAKSIQINNGAIIEGFCSLSYSAVDIDTLFE